MPNRDLQEVARRFHESYEDADPGWLSETIHEDAEMTLVMTHFRSIRGKEAILEALFRPRESLFYSAHVDAVEWIAEQTLLVRGDVRHAVEYASTANSRIWWVDEFRDGLLWRVTAFRNESEAPPKDRCERLGWPGRPAPPGGLLTAQGHARAIFKRADPGLSHHFLPVARDLFARTD
jgi:hypothetical protein